MDKAQGFLNGNGDDPRTLVVVFLRGAADGLSMVVPMEDDGYYNARPRIAVAKSEAITLDGLFGLNPKLKDLETPFKDGALTIIHGAGSEDTTRSHFEAQDLMEHGGVAGGGWLGRFLRYRPYPASGALSAVALGEAFPECLRGAPSATVLQNLDTFSFGSGEQTAALTSGLEKLYSAEPGEFGASARATLEALRRIEAMRGRAYQPERGAKFPKGYFGDGLLQAARLIKARVGLEAVSVDLSGWDSHFTQETIMNPRMTQLAEGLNAFYRDMGRAMETTTVVVMTEFGRRVHENSSFGTDHGRGGVMFVMGGGVKGGRVLADWKGLSKDLLEGPGDLPVTNNYRDVLAPVLRRHGSGDDFSLIFPDYQLQPVELYA